MDPVGLGHAVLTPGGGHAGGWAKTSTTPPPAEKVGDFPCWLARPVLRDLLEPVLSLRFCSRKLNLAVIWSSLLVTCPSCPTSCD